MVRKQFGRIIVAFDNSNNSIRALKKALHLANKIDAKITLVHVISYHKAVAKIVGSYKGTLIKYVTHFMDKAAKQASKLNVPLEQKILYGNTSEEILKLTRSKKFDLIVVGRRGTNYITGPSLGSVSNALVQNSSIPVMVIS